MKITQGTFSFLPPLTDEQIEAQMAYAVSQGWAISIEYTDDPHPRNSYWEMYGPPLFDLEDGTLVMRELASCRQEFSNHYIKVNAYDASLGRQSLRLSFIVNRPADEPGFRLERQEGPDRQIRYTTHPYAADRPAGRRYANGSGSAR
ncbi:MAG: ribulose bisphosphate carboxylase small subunit [Gaiellaceae bacterium]